MAYFRKERSQVNNLSIHVKKLEELVKLQISKELIKIRVEINLKNRLSIKLK